MKKKIIRITYRHVINSHSQSSLDKMLFNNTWQEFLLKSQAYNPGNTMDAFNEIRQADGRANSLHYKIALAASGIIGSLRHINPFVQDYSGKNIAFEDYNFELLESSVSDKTRHVFAVNFVSPGYRLHDISGDLLVRGKSEAAPGPDGMYQTFMIKTEKNLYISSYKEEEVLS